MYSIGGADFYPGSPMSGYYLQDGDTLTLRYTLAYGWDVGTGESGYGNNVVISHADGRLTRYAHNSKLLVKAGQHVEQGEPIALSGSTGRSTGPHVHFEIYINGSAVDPLKYISN